MPRRNPPAKWVLPSVVNPSGRKTIVLCIPDEPQHVAAFRGALQALGSAYNWADDEGHTAKDVAKVWRDVIDMGDSCMEFRQDACHLYLVANGIETLIYNGQECIDANIADGTIAKANSGYIGDIPLDDCKNYTVRLTTDQNWIAPNVMNSGDTLLLSNWQGGATDLGLLNTVWICPSGTAYQFGGCSDTIRSDTIYGTDPLQTAPHLAVIGQIGNTYYDIWNSASGITPAEFTVPAGVVNQPLRLLMNLGPAVGLVATGEMWGEITICNKQQWCFLSDFRDSLGSWVIDIGHRVANEGIRPDPTGYPNQQGTYVRLNIPSGVMLTQMDMVYDLAQIDPVPNYPKVRGFTDVDLGGSVMFTAENSATGTNLHCSWSGSASPRSVLASAMGYAGTNQRIISVKLRGIFPNPFGADNC